MDRDIFDDIAKSDVTKRSGKIRAGRYVFVLRNLTMGKKRKGLTTIFELVVLKATQIKKDVEPNEVGSVVGHFACFYGKQGEVAPGIVKEGICALFNQDPAKIDKKELADTLADVFSEANQESTVQPMRGFMVQGETAEGGENGERAYLHLSSVDPALNTQEEIEKRRKELESNADLGSLDEEAAE